MILFFVGIIEMLIITVWTKTVSKSMVLSSGLITIVNVFIWYYVLQNIIDNIDNWYLVLLYAFGCSLGTIISTGYYRFKEESEEAVKD